MFWVLDWKTLRWNPGFAPFLLKTFYKCRPTEGSWFLKSRLFKQLNVIFVLGFLWLEFNVWLYLLEIC
jgi:hypothetical protein